MPLVENGKRLYLGHPNEESDIVTIQILSGVLAANHLKLIFFKLEEHTLSELQKIGARLYML